MPDGTYFWLCKTFRLRHNYWHSMKTINLNEHDLMGPTWG